MTPAAKLLKLSGEAAIVHRAVAAVDHRDIGEFCSQLRRSVARVAQQAAQSQGRQPLAEQALGSGLPGRRQRVHVHRQGETAHVFTATGAARIVASGAMLDPTALTIGFARRFTGYKRPDLVFRDAERLARMITAEDRPLQFVFAGKAHPADEPGKKLIQKIANLRHDPRFAGRVVFIEDYDINVARHMVQGVDVWLNNPRRPLEASGTSGQKAVLNGGLNLSILDGWWAEAFDGQNGFAIGTGFAPVYWIIER